MITNYLIELLKDNECVIVPGFGAFISKGHSATIDYANHRFMPPYKEIVFNNQLNNDDSILVDFISRKENISKEESYEIIKNFVHQCEAVIDVNSEHVLEGFGKIRKFGNDYVFKANEDINFLGDSFGLTDFNFQPVFRTETYQIIKEKIIVEQKEKNTEYSIALDSVETVDAGNSTLTSAKRKPSLFRTVFLTLTAFFLLFVINWTTDKTNSNMAGWNPFLYSSPNEFLIRTMQNENGIEAQTCKHEETVVESEVLKTIKTEDIESQKLNVIGSQELDNSAVQELEPVLPPHYFIVGGSFQTAESAEKCLNNIRKQGFENASILDKNEKGFIRVYYESFSEKSDALIRLDMIKNDFNESAWLLFKK